VKSIVWFEPERVTQNSWLYDKHPEWLLAPPVNPGDQLYDSQWRLLDLGNPKALGWLIDHVDGLIESEGIDLYRQDFNVDPLLFWQAHDAPDREGISEIKHVTGYLAYWDALRERHPQLRIDTCASGGRRLDLETLRRSVPLVRSDYLFEPTGQQCHTYGLASWVPYHGTGTLIGKSAIGQHTSEELDSYDFRSHMAGSVTACWDMRREDLNYEELRRFTKQLDEAAPYFVLGDFYPLTPYSDGADVWIAWQYDRPDEGTGVVQAFRREGNTQNQHAFHLQGLDADAQYEIRAADNEGDPVVRNAKLVDDMLTIEMPKPRSAALVFYRKRSDTN
jgi:alpha-galactosidase